MGLNISLIIWSYPFVGIYFVNNGTNSVSFEKVRTKKKYIVKMFSIRHSWSLLLYNVCTRMLTWYNRWMVSFVNTIFYVSKIIWQKKRNLIILDNSGIDYSRMLLFVLGFLVYWKIEPNSRALATPGLWLDYKAVTSKLSKKQNVTSRNSMFKVLLQ